MDATRRWSGPTGSARSRIKVVLAVAAFVAAAAPAATTADPPQTSEQALPSESWKDLPPARRRELRQRYLQSLEEDQRDRLRHQAERFRALPDHRKRDLCEQFVGERGYLPPACKGLLQR